MKVTTGDGSKFDLDSAALGAKKTVQAVLREKKKLHKEQVSRLVSAVFLGAVEDEIRLSVKEYARYEVEKFFRTKTGKAAIKEVTERIAKQQIEEMSKT